MQLLAVEGNVIHTKRGAAGVSTRIRRSGGAAVQPRAVSPSRVPGNVYRSPIELDRARFFQCPGPLIEDNPIFCCSYTGTAEVKMESPSISCCQHAALAFHSSAPGRGRRRITFDFPLRPACHVSRDGTKIYSRTGKVGPSTGSSMDQAPREQAVRREGLMLKVKELTQSKAETKHPLTT